MRAIFTHHVRGLDGKQGVVQASAYGEVYINIQDRMTPSYAREVSAALLAAAEIAQEAEPQPKPVTQARSCPTCRSIGAPNNGCTDRWHLPATPPEYWGPGAQPPTTERRCRECLAGNHAACLLPAEVPANCQCSNQAHMLDTTPESWGSGGLINLKDMVGYDRGADGYPPPAIIGTPWYETINATECHDLHGDERTRVPHYHPDGPWPPWKPGDPVPDEPGPPPVK